MAKVEDAVASFERNIEAQTGKSLDPAGLNASSQGELTSWRDYVAAFQEAFFAPNLKIILNFIQLSLWGEIDPSRSTLSRWKK